METLSDESSNIFEATFPEYRKSSESSSEEATPDNSAPGKKTQRRKEVLRKPQKPRIRRRRTYAENKKLLC